MQKSQSFIFLTILFLQMGLISCVSEEIFDTPPEGFTFRVSLDTVSFDTVFTQRGSTSRRLFIYNDAPQNLTIASIGVSESSPFSLIINGIESKSVTNEVIRSGDSIQVFVKVNIDPNNSDSPFLVIDSLEINSISTIQYVQLKAFGRDAVYYGDEVFREDLQWSAGKAIVLQRSVLVDSATVLTISPGTQIYADRGAYLFVAGTLRAEGELDKKITFLNSRQDGAFRNAPGQWGGIIFLEGSNQNAMDHIVIRNAEYGIRMGTPDLDTIPNLILTNAIIENTLTAGVITFTSDIFITNTLINNSVGYTAAFLAGGWIDLNHLTIVNFGIGINRNEEAFIASDQVVLANGQVLRSPMRLDMKNSIVWGNYQNEVILFEGTEGNFNRNFSHNLIRTNQIFWDNTHILNQNPQFVSPQGYDYRLNLTSPARGKGVLSNINLDLKGNQRSDTPTIGAYEVVIE
jgi:hypothetical protein